MIAIKIGKFKHDNPNEYQVKITERIAQPDDLHFVDRIITSPRLVSIDAAKSWLIGWLNRELDDDG